MRPATIAFLLSISSFAFAADPLPKPVTKTVDAFAGKWTFQMTMTLPGAKPVKFTETFDCQKAALGRAVTCADRAEVPGMGKIEYAWLISYDVETKTVHAFAVGSPGEVHDHKASWKDDKVLAFEPLKATMGGQPITETLTMTFDGPTCTISGATTTKDGPIKFEGTGKKK